MRHIFRIFYLISFVLLLVACNSTKFVGEGEYLLDKVTIESDNSKYNSVELKPYLRQQPNFKTFGLTKWQLFLYGWSGRNEKKWINKQLRRMGEPPVILDTAFVNQSVEEFERFFTNKGYINAEVTAEIDTTKRKKATVYYKIRSNEPYIIKDYKMELNNPTIDSIARLTPPKRSALAAAFRSTSDEYTPQIKVGDLFDRDRLDKERQRLTTLLRRRGYYSFNRDYIAYQADSSFNQHAVDLEMKLKPFREVKPDGTVVEKEHRPYYIKDVFIVTDYDPLNVENEVFFTSLDTVKAREVYVLYGNKKRSMRPGVLRKSNYIVPGALFNERGLEQTYSSFGMLNALKNVNIRFDEIEENDSLKLNCTILTTPAKTHGFGVDLEGTNSNGDLGFASSLNYRHRNLFKGSEVFSAKIRGAYESLAKSNIEGSKDYWEMGGEASFAFPRFVFPFLKYGFRRKIRATTEFKTSYNKQTRPEYQRAIVSGSWGYNWQDRNNSLIRHSFKLIDVDYLHLSKINTDFLESLPKPTQLYSFTDQFIAGSSYTFSFNNYNPQFRQRNTHSLRLSIELMGNTLYALSKLTGAKKDDNGIYTLFGIKYSQYTKADMDFSKGITLDDRNRIVFHLGMGVALPYGNAERIPFERRYFAGGANSVRGWSVRSLGPGGMTIDTTTTFVQQAGDIRLDANLEYRTKLFWKLQLAAYVDAGNIWTIRPYEEQKGGNFDFARFYKEIAMSYGLGLRLDFDFFLIRFDTGMKAFNPQERGAKQWAITDPGNFNKNFAWHFAVGYPF